VSQALLGSLPHDDQAHLREMIGDVFEVEEVDALGQAWVTKWWKDGRQHSYSHGIGLSPSQMELV
jgi:hypothetical protein